MVDSRVATHGVVSNKNPNYPLNDIQNMKKFLQGLKKHIFLQWVPLHIGIIGNELADQIQPTVVSKKEHNCDKKQPPLKQKSRNKHQEQSMIRLR